MSIKTKTQLVMVMEDYSCEEKQKLAERIDFSASQGDSDDKILLRIITKPKSKSGSVGVDAVTKMIETLESENYDKGVLVGKRFTAAARREMKRQDIQIVSERYMPLYKPQELYLKIQDCVDNICTAKCGKVPEEESDCKGYSDGNYTCEARRISDDALFHFEHRWTNLLQNDVNHLIPLRAKF
jgi:hypothetical protein